MGGNVGETIELFLKILKLKNNIIRGKSNKFQKLKLNNENFAKKYRDTKIYIENLGIDSEKIIKINQF